MWSAQEYLPLEILEKIMMHLDLISLKAARQVCEYWKTVAEQRIEKSKYILLEGNIEIKKEALKIEGSDSDLYDTLPQRLQSNWKNSAYKYHTFL